MGLFDLFSKKTPAEPKGDEKSTTAGDAKAKAKAKDSSPKELARLARIVSNKMSQNYDRQEAIEQLSEMANADSARALLKRFDECSRHYNVRDVHDLPPPAPPVS